MVKMRKQNLLHILLFLFFASGFQSQEVIQVPLEYNTSGYAEKQAGSPQSADAQKGIDDRLTPTISAEMSVGESGALTYTLPIEIHKGINDFQPNIALSYNSQGGNGMAGWGWNIMGLSSISIGGQNKEIDGITRGAQYDATDPYYLDGVRLIKLDDNNFVTEKFSKIKITKQSTGEFQFIIQYTDGKVAKYKELTPGQFYISVFQDAFNNTINYTYQVDNYVARITKISYGGTGDPFSINFEYKLRKAQTEAYRNGIKYINKYVVSNIYSHSTYDGIFRKYILDHDFINSNTNERIRRIDVENKDGSRLKPLAFDYNLGVTTGYVNKYVKGISKFPKETKELGDIVAGDFYGTGELVTFYIAKGTDGSFSLISSKGSKIDWIPVEPGSKLIVGKALSNDNKITDRDQLIIANTGLFATLRVIDLLTKEVRTMSTGFQSNGTWTWDIMTGQMSLNLSANCDNYVSGDFNNDGLLDLIHFIPGDAWSPLQINAFEVGKTLGSSTETIPFSIPNLTNPGGSLYLNFDRVYQIEMDGDGIPELMFIDGEKYSVYKIDFPNKRLVPMDNLQGVVLPDFVNNIYTKRFTPLIFGDFNGDGLTDFMTPKKIYFIDKDNSAGDVAKKMETEPQMWWQYISTGKSFISSTKDYTAQKLSYITPSQRSYFRAGGSFWKQLWSGPDVEYDYTEYGATTIIPMDFNNDGKTDLISFSKFGKVKYSDTQKLGLAEVQNLDVKYFDPNGGTFPWFLKDALYTNKIFFHENNNTGFSTLNTVLPLNADLISPFSIPLQYTTFNFLNTYRSKLAISDPFTGKELSFTIDNDKFTEQLIKKVSNGSGVDQLVDYKPMMTDTNNNLEKCYINNISTGDFRYPYYVHKNNGSTYLVNKINTLFDGKILTKEYRYENAIQHLWGKGFLGFQKTYVSDAYESQLKDGKYINKAPMKALFWTNTTRDPLMDNAIIRSTYGGINRFITDNNIFNFRFDKGNHQYMILATDEINKDNLRNIKITKRYEYDETDNLKLKKATTDYNGIGSSVSSYSYKPEFSNGGHYFYGKITSVENTTSKGSLVFTTKDESDYDANGNVSQIRKYGNSAASAPIVTTLIYDSFGNTKSKTVSTTGLASQTESYDYDNTNRYIVKTTSPDGLFSTAIVNTLGRTSSETSSLGLNTSYNYDEWGNIIEVIDFLGKKTTISKSVADASTGGVYNLHKKREGGIESIVTFDRFDREVQTKSQAVNGKWFVSKIEYDIFGRKIKTSEPFFDGETVKWNTIEYDELNRPVKNIVFTGKVITTCYEGLKVTVDDGRKKTAKTLDAMGHVIKQQDHGGVINFSYYPNGALRDTSYEGIKTSIEIDGWGNKIKLTDPTAGMFTYEYDNFSRITKETNPKGYTLYTYDDLGRPQTEKTYGKTTAENTNIEKTYIYDGQTKLPKTITGTSNGKSFVYTTYYDQYYRIIGKKEETPDFIYSSSTTFDDFGRADILNISTQISGYTSNSSIKNVYDSNGILIQKNDNVAGNMIWHLSSINSKGQITQMEYGNGYTITNQYNAANQSLTNIKHQNSNNGNIVLDVDYNYDVNKGILNSRQNNTFGRREDFTYDTLNRLLSESLNGALTNEYTYDNRGRLTSNTELGTYKYNSNDYKINGIDFNVNGESVIKQRGFSNITYNAFKSPNKITLGKEDINFEYNILRTRYAMQSRKNNNVKYYSSDFSIEIKSGIGQANGVLVKNIEIVTYLTGDPYSGEYIKKEILNDGVLAESNNYYLHRDNLGSILGITKADGSVVEKRFFDAWGNLKALTNSAGQTTTNTKELANAKLFLDRGYTGHEHLWTVGLVNMNARLYDPILRKFLSPDNLVPDVFNTQSYDLYGYVNNNPLLYIDLDGNDPVSIGIGLTLVIAAAIGITTHIIINAINGIPVWYGLGKAAVISTVMGAVSFGIGSAASSAAVGFIGRAALQAGMHAMAGGIMSTLETGNFGSGFLSGAVSSIISSGIEFLGRAGGAISTAGKYSNFGSRNPDLLKAIMLVSGGLSGGMSSVIAGGNFWMGMRQGLITSGLNHLGHMAFEKAGEDISATKEDKDRYKETKTAYYKMLKEGKYEGALNLLTSTFKFNEGLVEYFCGYDIRKDDQTFFVTHSEAKDGAWIEIHTGFLKEFGTATRALFHEWHHIKQNYILIKFDKSYEYHSFREFDAYIQTVTNPFLPPAESSAMQQWTKSISEYWNGTNGREAVPAHVKSKYLMNLSFQFLLR